EPRCGGPPGHGGDDAADEQALGTPHESRGGLAREPDLSRGAARSPLAGRRRRWVPPRGARPRAPQPMPARAEVPFVVLRRGLVVSAGASSRAYAEPPLLAPPD